MPTTHIEWGDFEVFLHVARLGSLAAAGAVLGVNASTVQRRVGRLESALDVRLFERSPRGYALTRVGEELMPHAQAMEAQRLAIDRLLQGTGNGGAAAGRLTGRVRIETVDSLAVDLLAPILAGFRERHPSVTVDLRVRATFADLGRGETDVALRVGGRPSEPQLVPRPAGKVGLALYAANEYVAKDGGPTSLAELRGHRFVCGDRSMAEAPMERLVASHAAPEDVVFRSMAMLPRVMAIRDGSGIGFAPCFMCESTPGLVRLDIPASFLATFLWVVVHVDSKAVPRIWALAQYVADAVLAQGPRLDPLSTT